MIFIVKEYLNNNRCFTINDIVPFINVRLKKFSINLNYAGIREILKKLINKKFIFEGSKLFKDDVLVNENREKIYEFIKNHPGVYFNRIARELKLSNYILAWHLKILLRFEFIRNKTIHNHETFFNFEMPIKYDDILFFISKEKVEKIIKYLLDFQEGVSKTKISKELKMHSSTVTKYLTTLENMKIINSKKLSNKTIFFLNERYYYEVLRG